MSLPKLEDIALDPHDLDTNEEQATIDIRRPKNEEFIRTRADLQCDLTLLTYEREQYLISPELVSQAEDLCGRYRLYGAIDRRGIYCLCPAKIPDPLRPNRWHVTLHEILALAQTKWIRIVPDQKGGMYRAVEAAGQLAEPAWPDKTMAELYEIAFEGRYIDSMEHAVLKAAKGED